MTADLLTLLAQAPTDVTPSGTIDRLIHHWPRTLILLTAGLAVIGLTLRSLRKQRLNERYVLLFVLTGLPLIAVAIWPNAVVFLERVLVIEKATMLTLGVSIYFLLTTFALLSIVSVQERRIQTLAQLVAMMREQRGSDAPNPDDTAQPSPDTPG
ncbi:MAG: DUF2304 domain-containing protein [Planctomycetota bacterium]